MVRDDGNDYTTYGLVKWNGTSWKIEQVEFAHYPSTNKRAGKLNAIFVLDQENIFIATASQLLKWENEEWIEKAQFATEIPFYGQVNAIWASEKDNVYCVGNNGAIYHYTGRTWKQIDTGTDLDIQDIWGSYDEASGKLEILAIASDRYINNGNKLLKIDGEKATELSTNGLPWSIVSIWFKAKKYYTITGDGYFSNNNLSAHWEETKTFPLLYKHSIKGQALNSIALCGAYGLISYYNGLRWYNIEHTEQQKYLGIDIKDNMIVSVGTLHGVNACISIGRR